MRYVTLVIIAGVIALYFLDSALKIALFSEEMLMHSAIRFFIGLFLIGIGVFFSHKIKLKNALYLVVALFLLDDILDYYRDVESFRFEVMIHGVFMLVWGSAIGYVLMRQIKK